MVTTQPGLSLEIELVFANEKSNGCFTITIGISILIYIAIDNFSGRGINKLVDYYVAGRRAPTLMIIGTLVASLMSTSMSLGEVGFAYAGQTGPYL